MSHDTQWQTKLITMANQIARFMESKPHAEGVEGLANHINDFWEPRMRIKLADHAKAGGKGLSALALAACPYSRPSPMQQPNPVIGRALLPLPAAHGGTSRAVSRRFRRSAR